jgi:two-component system, cell cycle response regulator CtrA
VKEYAQCVWPAADVTTVAGWRSKDPGQRTIRTGRLLVDLDARFAAIEDRTLQLTGKEYAVLELLSLHKGTTLTKQMFLGHLYCGIDEPEISIFKVFVCKLRRKIARINDGNHYIETVRGSGYMLNDPPDDKRPAAGVARTEAGSPSAVLVGVSAEARAALP